MHEHVNWQRTFFSLRLYTFAEYPPPYRPTPYTVWRRRNHGKIRPYTDWAGTNIWSVWRRFFGYIRLHTDLVWRRSVSYRPTPYQICMDDDMQTGVVLVHFCYPPINFCPPILARQIRYTPTGYEFSFFDIMTCFYVLITNMQKLNSL